jgi:hypothetical protein
MDDDRSTAALKTVSSALVTVGSGRGFVMETPSERLILTTADCLPHLSRPDPGSDFRECTFFDLLGPLGATPTISAECLFVDSVADVAVLGEPKSLREGERDAYRAFVAASDALALGMMLVGGEAWLLTLEGEWERRRVRTSATGRSLIVVGADQDIAPGTSGSPILNAEGRALGIVSICNRSGEPGLEQHGQPLLASVLPVWLVTALTERAAQQAGPRDGATNT